MAITTRNQTAKTTAFYNFIVHYGIPARLQSDQVAQFESHLIREFCEITMIDKSRTTPYHPMSNGMTERSSRTLHSMLGTLENKEKARLEKEKPTLPGDVAFRLDNGEEKRNYDDYITD
ncbi:uncharacterized protein LOC134239505 [Saccostrea cucullata]|uniref:uncharacterized protein LOC134239505 n=1 Tax=Saccostrea cuccullata TaxID=36930 RepID=UPI002ED37E2D